MDYHSIPCHYEFECLRCGLYPVTANDALPFIKIAIPEDKLDDIMMDILCKTYIGFRIVFTQPNCPACVRSRQRNIIDVQVLFPKVKQSPVVH